MNTAVVEYDTVTVNIQYVQDTKTYFRSMLSCDSTIYIHGESRRGKFPLSSAYSYAVGLQMMLHAYACLLQFRLSMRALSVDLRYNLTYTAVVTHIGQGIYT